MDIVTTKQTDDFLKLILHPVISDVNSEELARSVTLRELYTTTNMMKSIKRVQDQME